MTFSVSVTSILAAASWSPGYNKGELVKSKDEQDEYARASYPEKQQLHGEAVDPEYG